MLEEIKSAISNIRQLRAIAKDVNSEWLLEVREKLDMVIQEKKDEEELAQLEAREREEKIAKLKAYIANELNESPESLLGELTGQPKKETKTSTVKPKYRYTDEKGVTRTWTGRGKKPKFFAEKIEQGESIDQYLIEQPE